MEYDRSPMQFFLEGGSWDWKPIWFSFRGQNDETGITRVYWKIEVKYQISVVNTCFFPVYRPKIIRFCVFNEI